MIDPHVHCRDWNQKHKETIEHALKVAERAGVTGIFDMPNTDPPIMTKELVEKRLADAAKVKTPVFYALYMGITSEKDQIKEAVQTHKEFFPKVIGLKMYAGHSVGNLGITSEEDQKLVYKVLSEQRYKGVLAVHCEKESLLKPNLWNFSYPMTHSDARPPEAEIQSIEDQINFATEAEFKGTLHIAHISLPQSVDLIGQAKTPFKVSCGVTPHHCLLYTEMLTNSNESILYKVNPPLRSKKDANKMFAYLKERKINFIETDHAPHTFKEKTQEPCMSGFPGLPFVPHFLKYLRNTGFSEEEILNLTHNNVCEIFGIKLPLPTQEPDLKLGFEYEFDVYKI